MYGKDNDIFSSENAEKASESQAYEVLENRIVDWDWEESPTFGDDQEPERVRTTIRIRPWQKSAIEMVQRKTGSSSNHVRFCAFKQGIKVLRENLDSVLWDHIGTIYDWATHLMTDYIHTDIRGDIIEDIKDIDPIKDPVRTGAASVQSVSVSDDPVNLPMIPNDSQHIEDEYIGPGFVGGWFKREVISLGLSDSETLTRMYKDNADEMRDVITDRLQWQHKQVGEMVSKYISHNIGYWADNGIHETALGDLYIISGRLVDMRQETVDAQINEIKRHCDILDHDNGAYTTLYEAYGDEVREKTQKSRDYYHSFD